MVQDFSHQRHCWFCLRWLTYSAISDNEIKFKLHFPLHKCNPPKVWRLAMGSISLRVLLSHHQTLRNSGPKWYRMKRHAFWRFFFATGDDFWVWPLPRMQSWPPEWLQQFQEGIPGFLRNLGHVLTLPAGREVRNTGKGTHLFTTFRTRQ